MFGFWFGVLFFLIFILEENYFSVAPDSSNLGDPHLLSRLFKLSLPLASKSQLHLHGLSFWEICT